MPRAPKTGARRSVRRGREDPAARRRDLSLFGILRLLRVDLLGPLLDHGVCSGKGVDEANGVRLPVGELRADAMRRRYAVHVFVLFEVGREIAGATARSTADGLLDHEDDAAVRPEGDDLGRDGHATLAAHGFVGVDQQVGDHLVDAVATACIGIGLGLSPNIWLFFGFMFLVAAFLFAVDVIFGYFFYMIDVLKNKPF